MNAKKVMDKLISPLFTFFFPVVPATLTPRVDTAITSSDGRDASGFLETSGPGHFNAGFGGYLMWLRINFPSTYEVEFFLLSMRQPQVSISISIRNATNIAGNYFCIKVPAGECVSWNYKYFEWNTARRWIGKYLMLYNENTAVSDIPLNFHKIEIFGHIVP